MTPEQQFKEWWAKGSGIGSEYIAKKAWLEAYRLGQQQGMEESAKICDYREELQRKTCGEDREIEARCCAEDIRQAANALKEIK